MYLVKHGSCVWSFDAAPLFMLWMQESRWIYLFSFLAFPAILQLCILPFLPESPRYLLMERRDEAGAEKGNTHRRSSARSKSLHGENKHFISSCGSHLTFYFFTPKLLWRQSVEESANRIFILMSILHSAQLPKQNNKTNQCDYFQVFTTFFLLSKTDPYIMSKTKPNHNQNNYTKTYYYAIKLILVSVST